jgi:hypothetical protein
LKTCGNVISLAEWDGRNSIILRHDVDLDIYPAFKMAEIESQHGITSSFFILTTGLYNPGSFHNRKMLREMIQMGFEIGLHFDTSIYDDEALDREFQRECDFLTQILDTEIRSYSFHNPSVNGKYPTMNTKLRNAYAPAIFGDGIYLSDSRLDFRGVDPYAFAERVRSGTIQMLLHPLHYSEDGKPYPEIFYRYAKRFIENVDATFRVNSKYCALLPNPLFDVVQNWRLD